MPTIIFYCLGLGAFIGWVVGDFERAGAVTGLILGGVSGMILRQAIRAEVAKGRAALHAEVEAMLAASRVDAAPAAPAPPQPAAPLSVPRTSARVVKPSGEPAAPRPDPVPEPMAWHREPEPPSPVLQGLRDVIFGGNTIVRAGLAILFVGLSFLARYAAAAGLFPIEARLMLIAAIGGGLIGVGFTLRTRRRDFGLALQGGGIGVIYLTIFAGARLFELVPASLAFVLMVALCIAGCVIALSQNAQGLAVAAFAGGYATPLLLASEGGSVLVLFGYFTLLNLAALFLANRRPWPTLVLLGFVATFGLAGVWGFTSYTRSDYALAQSFLIASLVIFIAAAMLPAPGGRRGTLAVGATLLFGPALAGFGLQVGLTEPYRYGPALSAVGMAALYLGAAWIARRRSGPEDSLRATAMTGIALGFATIAVPLAFDARVTSAVWALEGAGAVWLGVRQRRWLPRMMGLALQAAGLLAFLTQVGVTRSSLPIVNPAFVNAVLIALPLLASAWWLRSPSLISESGMAARYCQVEELASVVLFLIGFGLWWFAWTAEATRLLPGQPPLAVFDADVQRLLTMLAFVASAALAAIAGRAGDWRVATWPGRATLPVMAIAFVAGLPGDGRVTDLAAWPIWAVAIGLHLWLLRRRDSDPGDTSPERLVAFTHAGGVWLATAMIGDAVDAAMAATGAYDTSWPAVVMIAALLAILTALTRIGHGRAASLWPLERDTSRYSWLAAVPIAVIIVVAVTVAGFVERGATPPLPYVPLLNPLEIVLALGIAALVQWRRMIIATAPAGSEMVRGPAALATIGLVAFALVNTVWLRMAHHLVGIAWTADAMIDSAVVQTGLAILWTLVALALMVLAHRRAERLPWLAGAGLLAMVVLKLFAIDLNTADSAERIVTFMAVGGLMLVVGYFAPLPPRARDQPV